MWKTTVRLAFIPRNDAAESWTCVQCPVLKSGGNRARVFDSRGIISVGLCWGGNKPTRCAHGGSDFSPHMLKEMGKAKKVSWQSGDLSPRAREKFTLAGRRMFGGSG